MQTLTLYTSMASPFGRKVRMGAIICGLAGQIRIEPVDMANLKADFLESAPLAKVPVLIDTDGTSIYDSRVILEWMDLMAGGNRIVPLEPGARLAALRLQAIADGITDAGVLQVYERRHRSDDAHSGIWMERQGTKIHNGLRYLNEVGFEYQNAIPHVGEIALAAALGFSDTHFSGAWRPLYPKLFAWLDHFSANVPAWEQTRFAPAT